MRIDPPGCGCTDCGNGVSKPLDQCERSDLVMMMLGINQNATNVDPKVVLGDEVIMKLSDLIEILADRDKPQDQDGERTTA